MNLPYYYTENPSSSNENSDKLLFQYVHNKINTMNNSFTAEPFSLLNEYISSTVHKFDTKSPKPSRQHLENCLQFPTHREYQSKYVHNNDDIQLVESVAQNKSNVIYENKDETQTNMKMNRLKLNEFLYASNQSSPLKGPDYSNIKEYKFSQTINYKEPSFQPVDHRGYYINSMEKTKKSFTPNKKTTDEFLREFPLDELKRGVSSLNKKKKKIFDMNNMFSMKEKIKKNLNFAHDNPEIIRKIVQKARERQKMVFVPDITTFLNEYKILDKNGEDKTKIFLKRALLEDSAILFENFEVKIGMKSIFNEMRDKDHNGGLLIYLYYCNKNKGDLRNCSLKFANNRNLKRVKIFPSVYDFTIEGNSTKRQDFLIENFAIEDEVVALNFEYKNEAYHSHKILQKLQFPLPITANKFMEFQPLDATIFRTRWRGWKTNAIMSEPLIFDRQILMITDDILRYFPFLVNLTTKFEIKSDWSSPFENIKNLKNSHKNTNGKTSSFIKKKWGGSFTINGLREFLIKIRIVEDLYIYFEVCERNGEEKLARRVIETLCFMFCQN